MSKYIDTEENIKGYADHESYYDYDLVITVYDQKHIIHSTNYSIGRNDNCDKENFSAVTGYYDNELNSLIIDYYLGDKQYIKITKNLSNWIDYESINYNSTKASNENLDSGIEKLLEIVIPQRKKQIEYEKIEAEKQAERLKLERKPFLDELNHLNTYQYKFELKECQDLLNSVAIRLTEIKNTDDVSLYLETFLTNTCIKEQLFQYHQDLSIVAKKLIDDYRFYKNKWVIDLFGRVSDDNVYMQLIEISNKSQDSNARFAAISALYNFFLHRTIDKSIIEFTNSSLLKNDNNKLVKSILEILFGLINDPNFLNYKANKKTENKNSKNKELLEIQITEVKEQKKDEKKIEYENKKKLAKNVFQILSLLSLIISLCSGFIWTYNLCINLEQFWQVSFSIIASIFFGFISILTIPFPNRFVNLYKKNPINIIVAWLFIYIIYIVFENSIYLSVLIFDSTNFLFKLLIFIIVTYLKKFNSKLDKTEKEPKFSRLIKKSYNSSKLIKTFELKEWFGLLSSELLEQYVFTKGQQLFDFANKGDWNNVFIILRSGQFVNLVYSGSNAYTTLLHIAVNQGVKANIIQNLINLGASCTYKDSNNETAYDIAVRKRFNHLSKIVLPKMWFRLDNETEINIENNFHNFLRYEFKNYKILQPDTKILFPPISILLEQKKCNWCLRIQIFPGFIPFHFNPDECSIEVSINTRENELAGGEHYRIKNDGIYNESGQKVNLN